MALVSSDAPIIEGRAMEKFYAQPDGSRVEVIVPTDIAVHPGEFLALLGPSGCGKSTLLRMLTGLAKPSAGQVLWHGQPLDGQRPNCSIVFQSFALFPWLTVIDNVEAPLEARGVPALERHKRALKIIDAVGLDGFETAFPKELSGGMKQRVGVARALVVEPEVLFMDEPFSALAIFMVTHNIEEAVALADRIVVLSHNPARIRADFAVGLPHPRNRKAERFTQIVDYVYKILTQPAVQPGVLAATSAQESGQTSAPRKILMLPHVRPGGLAGLVEILHDRGGRADLHRLAADLSLEADDLLPTVATARILDFLRVEEGDAIITPEGAAFAQADILTRKQIFRRAALAHVPLLAQMECALKTKTDRMLPDEFFMDLLEEHFSEDESKRQLDIAINWGRYAELFDYNAATRRLILTET